MATKSKSTRARKAPSRKSRRASTADLAELHRDLYGARAAVMTAILALEGKGVDGLISSSLRLHVLQPLGRIADALGEEARP